MIDVRYEPRHGGGESPPNGVDAATANSVIVDTAGRAPAPRPRLGNVSSSCGWCGSEQIDDLCLRLGPLAPAPPIDLDVLAEVSATARGTQELFGLTGAVHAAAVFDREGRIVVAREDVGRHNAVDKVIGSMLLDGRLPLTGHGVHQRPGEHRDGPESVGGRCHDPACRERPDSARGRIGPSSGHDVGRLPPSGRLQRLFVAVLVAQADATWTSLTEVSEAAGPKWGKWTHARCMDPRCTGLCRPRRTGSSSLPILPATRRNPTWPARNVDPSWWRRSVRCSVRPSCDDRTGCPWRDGIVGPLTE